MVVVVVPVKYLLTSDVKLRKGMERHSRDAIKSIDEKATIAQHRHVLDGEWKQLREAVRFIRLSYSMQTGYRLIH